MKRPDTVTRAETPEPPAPPVLVGIAAGAPLAVVAYALVRVLERMLFAEPNPAMLIWSDQSAFVWRGLIAVYVGGAGAFAGYALAVRSSRAAARGLWATTIAAVIAIVAQGALFP